MYMDDETRFPKDRIGDETLRRMLDGGALCPPDLPPAEMRQATCMPQGGWGLSSHPLGMVYAPLQPFRSLYDRETALKQGTLFSELDLPFLGESVANRSKGGLCL